MTVSFAKCLLRTLNDRKANKFTRMQWTQREETGSKTEVKLYCMNQSARRFKAGGCNHRQSPAGRGVPIESIKAGEPS